MEDFNIRKFMVENKLTTMSKLVAMNENDEDQLNVEQLKKDIEAAIQALDEEDDTEKIKYGDLDHYNGEDVNIELNSDRDGSDAVFRYLEDYEDAEEFEEMAKTYNDDLIGYVRNGVYTPLMEPVG